MVKTVSERRMVEVGRLVVRTGGCVEGKLGTIVNIVDQNRVVLDGAGLKDGATREVVNIKDIELTDFVTPKIGFGARSAVVRKAVESAKTEDQWNTTVWAQKLHIRKAKAALDDFGRFQLRRAKRARNALVRSAFFKLEKAANKGKSKKAVKPTAAQKKAKKDVRAKKTAARIKLFKANTPAAPKPKAATA